MLKGFKLPKLHPAFALHVLAMSSVAFVVPQATVAKPEVPKLQEISVAAFSAFVSIE